MMRILFFLLVPVTHLTPYISQHVSDEIKIKGRVDCNIVNIIYLCTRFIRC